VSRYWYLASTLPSLLFAAQPPISTKEFLDTCRLLMPAEDFAEVESAPLALMEGLEGKPRSGFLSAYIAWARGFGNQLSKMRARGLGKNEEAFLRPGPQSDEAAKAATACFAIEDPYKAELAIAKESWTAIERLSALNAFDLDYLVAYRIKLAINERLARFAPEEGQKAYRRLYKEIFGTPAREAGSDSLGEKA